MRERRKRWLIDRFQHRLVARMVTYWFIYQMTLWHFLFCWRLLEGGQGNFLQEYGQFFRQSYPMLICFLILVPAFAWDAVKFFHQVAGPIYRFRQTVRTIAAEEPVRRIHLREGDQLLEFQDDFNAMLETLARRDAVDLIQETQAPVKLEGDSSRDLGDLGDLEADADVGSSDPLGEEPVHAASRP